MGKKINFQRSLETNQINAKSILKNDFLKNINILHIHRNSSDDFSFSNARVIESMLVLMIFVSHSFYVLKNINEKLSDGIKKDLESLKKITFKQISKDDPNPIELDFINYINNKLNLETTKAVFQNQRFIQFNSKSHDHYGALGKIENYNKTNNIIIKLKGSGDEKVHIRISLIIKNDREIELMDIVNKKNSPKQKN